MKRGKAMAGTVGGSLGSYWMVCHGFGHEICILRRLQGKTDNSQLSLDCLTNFYLLIWSRNLETYDQFYSTRLLENSPILKVCEQFERFRFFEFTHHKELRYNLFCLVIFNQSSENKWMSNICRMLFDVVW